MGYYIEVAFSIELQYQSSGWMDGWIVGLWEGQWWREDIDSKAKPTTDVALCN